MKNRIHSKVLLLFLFCAILCLVSCQKSNDGPKQPDKAENGGSDQAGGGLSQKVDGQGLTEKQKETAIELKGKVFGEMPAVGTEDPVYCNLPENATAWESHIPLCYDPVYDILYYVDYRDDSMIYAAKDGKSEMAVPVPGRRLFCRAGKLYFLLDAGTSLAAEGAENGNILTYDPVTGEVTVLSEETFDSIFVYQDLIYCRKVIENSSNSTKFAYSFYFFNTEELLTQEEQSPISYVLEGGMRYGEYFVAGVFGPYDSSNPDSMIEEMIQSGVCKPEDVRALTGWELCRWDGSGSIPLEGLDFAGGGYIKGDDIFWLGEEGVHTWNIPAQQDQVLAIERKGREHAIYFLIGSSVYAHDASNFIDVEGGRSQTCSSVSPDGFGLYIQEFYTDGKRTYGIAINYGNSSNQLYCIEWRSIEEIRGILSEEEEMLSAFEQILKDSSISYEGMLWLLPVADLLNGG